MGVSGEGIKRWGIEGIRIGTSDRFGRGGGEFYDWRTFMKSLSLQNCAEARVGFARFRVLGLGFGLGFRVLGFGFRVGV